MKDHQFKTSDASPITRFKRDYFEGLKYFDFNPQYIIPAQVEVLPKTDTITFATGSKVSIYVKAAMLHFKVNQVDQNLVALERVGGSSASWFIPFMDPTNGETTYSGGRYLDVVHQNSSEVNLDFNYSYNPYCAYNEEYLCFPPPAENDLTESILAGEKSYE